MQRRLKRMNNMATINQKIFKKTFVSALKEKLRGGEGLADYFEPEVSYPPEAELQSTIQVNSEKLKLRFRGKKESASNDVENAIALYEAFPDLTEAQASDQRLWVYLSHVTLRDYVQARWPLAGSKEHIASDSSIWPYIVTLSRWIIIVAIFFFSISLLYRYGPAHKLKWKFLSPGSVLATTLAVLTSIGFTYYINNFSSYNKIYGSIGTLIVVMLWLYLNSLILLIGFELNANIDLAKRNIKVEKPRFNNFRNKQITT